jgi:hypothetical protein
MALFSHLTLLLFLLVSVNPIDNLVFVSPFSWWDLICYSIILSIFLRANLSDRGDQSNTKPPSDSGMIRLLVTASLFSCFFWSHVATLISFVSVPCALLCLLFQTQLGLAETRIINCEMGVSLDAERASADDLLVSPKHINRDDLVSILYIYRYRRAVVCYPTSISPYFRLDCSILSHESTPYPCPNIR